MGIWLLAGFTLWLVFAHRGLFFTIDTTNYFSAAFHWVQIGKPLMFDGTIFRNAPPLFVLFCMPAWLFSIPVEIYTFLLQLLFLLGFIFGLNKLCSLFSIPQSAANLAFISFFGFAWLHVWPFALTEALYTAMLIWWVYFLFSKRLLGSVILFCLMALLKYQTWYLVPGLIWLAREKYISVWALTKLIAIGALFTGIWFAYLHSLNISFLGDHKALDKVLLFGLAENLGALVQMIRNGGYKSIVALPILLTMTSITVFFRRKVTNPVQKPFLTFVFIQVWVALVCIAGTRDLDWNQMPRYLGVFWPLASTSLLISLLSFGSNQTKLNNLVGVLGFVCLTASLAINLKSVKFLSMSHYTFSISEKDLQDLWGKTMVSNFPDLVWWQTKQTCVYAQFKNETKQDYLKRIPQNPKYLLWINSNERNHVMAPLDSLMPINTKKPRRLGRGFVLYEYE